MNKISIITISFNNSEGLEKTMESVFRQTYRLYEYIVIDGGSSDGSADLLKRHDDKIAYWVSEPDKGIYNAMNKGLDKATGDYVHFLNAGDSYASDDVLERFFAEEQSVPFIRGTQICNYGNRTEIWTNMGEEDLTVFGMYENTMLHQATFIRRDMFDKYGKYDETLKITADWKFFFKAILGNEKTSFRNIPVVDFEMFGISTSGEYGAILKKERAEVIRELMPSNYLPDYEKLFDLNKDSYIIDFVKSNRFFLCTFKVFRRICLMLGIGKTRK
ncbi:glycosyltransferase family 2 protein [Dysgonomonas sp. 520]|uniref:glycosyltransferase family 2 protein n=1 Tax=Dysgonomonas sp. 520 TaxID=2302931 RepID=UPI0013D7A6DD|nr:glycosyltransferase family 2 protein [Dysgonomonas sp. 520]NDW09805.1 glycosyltransferase [Dysgonomonas sp. 520]